MSKTYIFAIGGTGARVLRSLTMLMASGGVNTLLRDKDGNPIESTICPIIIDYDAHNGDKDRAIESMKRYSTVHNLVMKGKTAGLDASLTKKIMPFFNFKINELLPNYSWQFDFKHDKKLKFREYIGYDDIALYSSTTKNLVECLYDTDNTSVYTELDLNMTQGFQGNPNIGSVVFDDLKNCEEFNQFANDFREGDRIVVIGSIFGGTGSSGIPKIVAAIRNHQTTIVKQAEISVVLVLPYFAVGKPKHGEISINSNIFNSKTKAALNYYESSKTNEIINNIYYIGDKVPTKVEPHIGDKEQKNNAHIVELISAMSVLHVMTNTPNPNFGTKYKFCASSNDIQNGIGLDELVGASATQWSQNSFVRNVVHGLINFTYVVKYFLDEIITPEKRMMERQFYKELHLHKAENKTIWSTNSSLPIQDYCAALYNFICKEVKNKDIDDGYWQWLQELHATNHGAHKLNIFNLKDDLAICDLLHKKNFRKDPIVVCGVKINSDTPLLTYDNAFDSEMNKQLVPYRQGKKQLEEKDEKSYPWIFNHVLYEMAEAIRTFTGGEKLLPERFKLVP